MKDKNNQYSFIKLMDLLASYYDSAVPKLRETHDFHLDFYAEHKFEKLYVLTA